MDIFIIRFMREYNATCLWPVSKNAYEHFGIPIQYVTVGLSETLIKRLECFDDKILGIIDWNSPSEESPMSIEERTALYQEGKSLMDETVKELGDDFQVINGLGWILL